MADFSYFVLHDPDEFEDPPKKPSCVSQKSIEDYKEIIDGILLCWGNEKYLHEFLQLKGLHSTSPNKRHLPQSVIDELNLLIKIHYDAYGPINQKPPNIVKTSLEDYPHLMEPIKTFWWKPEDFHEFLDLKKLAVQERERIWFPQSVVDELILLTEIHDAVYGLPKPKKKHDFEVHQDNWNIDNKIR